VIQTAIDFLRLWIRLVLSPSLKKKREIQAAHAAPGNYEYENEARPPVEESLRRTGW
jgi:hypothetical protein